MNTAIIYIPVVYHTRYNTLLGTGGHGGGLSMCDEVTDISYEVHELCCSGWRFCSHLSQESCSFCRFLYQVGAPFLCSQRDVA